LSKQGEILSSCGKGQGQHMEKNHFKKIKPFFWQVFLGVSVFTSLTGFRESMAGGRGNIGDSTTYLKFPISVGCFLLQRNG
jgi:hypothetical protein